MNHGFRGMEESDRKDVIDIFNYFIENGFAAFHEEKVKYEFFDIFLKISKGYPAIVVIDKDKKAKVIGFAFMRRFNPFKTFNRSAELSYFIMPQYTGKGIGMEIMDFFINEARNINIDCLLAEISSLNEQSINFHKKCGFGRCGCLKRVGRKFGKDFDIVWMQKLL